MCKSLLLDISFFLYHVSRDSEPQFLSQHFIVLWWLLSLNFSKLDINLKNENKQIRETKQKTKSKTKSGHKRSFT